MMFWYGAHWAFWQAGLMWAGMLVFWGLLIGGAYILITAAIRRPDRDDRDGGARSILDDRLARGEIDAEEYERLRELITDRDHQPPARVGRSAS